LPSDNSNNFFSPEIFLRENQEIKIDNVNLKIIETPGHTPDSICLLGSNFIFSGDTIFADAIGRTDLEGGSSLDMAQSLCKLQHYLYPGMIIYPGHGDIFVYKKEMLAQWQEYLAQ